MHILLTRQEIKISCCCFFSSHNQGMFLPSTNSHVIITLGLQTLYFPLKIVAECSREHECMMYNLILIATPSAPVVYAPSAFFFIIETLLGSCCSSQTSRFVERGRNNIVLRLRPLSSQSLAATSKAFSKGSLSLCGKLRETAAEEKIFFHRSR